MSIARSHSVAGFILALSSSATFALSGIFAAALIPAGWSAGAAVTLRIVFAALVLLAPTIIMLRGRWHLVWRAWRAILLFGILAVVGCQVMYFLALEFIAPSLALLIEFMGPVILVFWTWASTRVAPSWVTLLGAAIAVGGLVIVSGVVAGAALHPLGVLFSLVAAVGLASYFATGASTSTGIPPLPFVGLGLIAGAIFLIILIPTRVLPFEMSSEPAVLAGVEFSPILVLAGLVLLATALPYVLGVAASRRLGATVSSFTGYAEPLFGIVWTIVLLAIVPTVSQWWGALLIIAGVVCVKIGDVLRARRLV